MLSGKEKEQAKKLKDAVIKEIRDNHLTELVNGGGKVFKISGAYPGVWIEHAYDGVAWANYDNNEKEISINHVNIFLNGQKQNGQLPFNVRRIEGESAPKMGYSQIQECVSFASVCLEAAEQNNLAEAELSDLYTRLKKWDEWLVKNRFNSDGLMMTFCGFDTGHDFSARVADFGKYEHRFYDSAEKYPADSDVLPVVMPDMNAVVYGNRRALQKLAKRLKLDEEATEWGVKAEKLKKRIYDYCYDEQEDYFFDVDKRGNKRKIKSIALSSLFVERVLDKEEGQRLFKKYFLSPEHFGTPYPYPSLSVSDKLFVKNLNGNSWNYFCQGLTMLRTLLWMDEYGFSEQLENNMEKWVGACVRNEDYPFSQELDPFTGKASTSSVYYSSTMLFFLHSIKRLGIDK